MTQLECNLLRHSDPYTNGQHIFRYFGGHLHHHNQICAMEVWWAVCILELLARLRRLNIKKAILKNAQSIEKYC